MCVVFCQGPVVVDRTSLKSLRVNSPVLGSNPSLGIMALSSNGQDVGL